MRLLILSLGLWSAVSLRVCSSESSSSVSSSANATLASPLPPRIGGSVIAIGPHSVELVVHRDGAAEALVLDGAGKPENAAVGKLMLSPPQPAKPIELAFSAASGQFEGHAAPGAFVPGKYDVSIEGNGKMLGATLPDVAVLRAPELGGSVLSVGNYGAEVFARPNGEVLAFVQDAAGRPVHGEAGLTLDARVATAGAPAPVRLAFDPKRRCFAGKAQAALIPGPLELTITSKAGPQMGRIAACPLRATAAHGGEVVVAGEYGVELVPQGAQQVSAYVYDARGNASARADLGMSLELAGAPSVALAWDAPSASYRGDFAAGVDFDARPLSLVVVSAGRPFRAHAQSLRAVMAAGVDGTVNVSARAAQDARVGVRAVIEPPVFEARVGVPDVRAEVHAGAPPMIGIANAGARVNLAPGLPGPPGLPAPPLPHAPPLPPAPPVPHLSVGKGPSVPVPAGRAKASASFSIGR